MGLAPNFATVFFGDSIGCEVPDPIFSQPLRVSTDFTREDGILCGDCENSFFPAGVPVVRVRTSLVGGIPNILPRSTAHRGGLFSQDNSLTSLCRSRLTRSQSPC